MENAGNEISSWALMGVGLSVIVIIQLFFYLRKFILCNDKGTNTNASVKHEASTEKIKEKQSASSQTSQSSVQKVKSQKKQTSNNWKNNKSNFNHSLLATNLMGHTQKIMDLDCSSDGKHLVSCAEDEALDSGESSGRSSSEGSRSPSGGSSPNSPRGERRLSRQRKRRRPRPTREVGSLATSNHSTGSLTSKLIQTFAEPGPLERYIQLKMSYSQLADSLKKYLLTDQQLATLGYPIPVPGRENSALIYTTDFKKVTSFDVNAREFVPLTKTNSNFWARDDDSGRGSGTSSPRSGDSDPDSEEERYKNCIQRNCVRCHRGFYVDVRGEYLSKDRCRHHWGRLQRVQASNMASEWTCCGLTQFSPGCTKSPCHVWSGRENGFNGPLIGFVKTRNKPTGLPRQQVLALDTEMCYSTMGLQVAKVEVVRGDGQRIYSTFVVPEKDIIDYNTRYSGICEMDLRKATKSIADVQRDLLRLIDAQTILIGHGLENDLRVLRIIHSNIVDTAICFPHVRGLPYRQSLKSLAAQFLDRSVQQDQHCALEDARASLDLILWKIINEPYSSEIHTSSKNNIAQCYREFLRNLRSIQTD